MTVAYCTFTVGAPVPLLEGVQTVVDVVVFFVAAAGTARAPGKKATSNGRYWSILMGMYDAAAAVVVVVAVARRLRAAAFLPT